MMRQLKGRMDKLNVIMIGPEIDMRGGISFVVKEYLKAGLDKKVSLFFVSSYKNGSMAKKISVFIKALFDVSFLSFKIPNSIVHIHVSQNGSFYRKVIIFSMVKLFRRKTIIHLHGSQFEAFMTSNRLLTFLTRWMFNQADLVLVLSKDWEKKLLSFCDNRNIQVLYNPITPVFYKRNGDDSIGILFLGRLGKRKGIYDLLECIGQGKDYFILNRVKFILAGDGDVKKVRNIVKEMNLENFVNVPGWIAGDQKEEYLKTADVIILPSYNEQMPMSILEGMGYGYPIIATTIAGIPEMVENGGNGFLFRPGDIEEMTKALKKICEDKCLMGKMGHRSHEIVREKFDSKMIGERLVNVYKELH